MAARAVVFDVDGTLYHQAPLRREMARQLVVAHAMHPLRGRRVLRALSAYRHAQENLRHASGANLAMQQIELASSNSGIPTTEMQRLVERWMETTPLGVLSRFARAGLRPSLVQLRANGARLAVLSDYPSEQKLRALGVDDLFDVVLCAQDPTVGVFKPHPRGIEVAVERLGVSCADAVYVGDRPEVDAAAARAARVACVIVGSRPANSHDDFLTVATFEDLTATFGGPQ